jgi:hypothetical protein
VRRHQRLLLRFVLEAERPCRECDGVLRSQYADHRTEQRQCPCLPSPADSNVWNYNIELRSMYACSTRPLPGPISEPSPVPSPQPPPGPPPYSDSDSSTNSSPPSAVEYIPIILVVCGCLLVIGVVVVVVIRCVRLHRGQSQPAAASLLSGSRSAPVMYTAPGPAAAAAPALHARATRTATSPRGDPRRSDTWQSSRLLRGPAAGSRRRQSHRLRLPP